MNTVQPHLRISKGDVNEFCIVVGHPDRVILISKHLRNLKKISDNRGYVTYNGTYEGIPLTVCCTGIGGPSAAIVFEELINCGVKTIIRVGSGAVLKEKITKRLILGLVFSVLCILFLTV